jgi:DNA/RNA endonuclease G (NUC1)
MLEEMVHKQVNASGQATHVITGVIFNGYNKTIGVHHIAIPVAYYKIVYLNTGIEVFYGANVENSKVQHVSIADLQKYVSFKIR